MNVLIDIATIRRSKILLFIDSQYRRIDEIGPALHGNAVDIQEQIDLFFQRYFEDIFLYRSLPADFSISILRSQLYRLGDDLRIGLCYRYRPGGSSGHPGGRDVIGRSKTPGAIGYHPDAYPKRFRIGNILDPVFPRDHKLI